ncbi:MAG: DNA-processing protein DprA [Mycobacteriales bacterium]
MRRPLAAEVRLARAWLSRAVEPGRGSVFDLVTEVGPVEAARLLRSGSATGAVASLAEARRREDRAAEDLAEAAQLGVRLVTPEDDEWPDEAIRATEIAYFRERTERAGGQPARERVELTPPLALWVLGARRLDELLARSVSIVGSRSATPYGEHVAADLAHGLASRRWTVVSGAAFGIDGAAHRGALAAVGPTVAIVAGGLRDPYPRGHSGLFRRLARDGLVVSEFPPDATPQRHRFLVRNRLIAGLTAGTVVVEAGIRSGALSTGRQALRMGRAVMAVPGPVTSAESSGVHELLRTRPDVTLVTRTAEVVELVGAIGADLAPRPEAPATVRDALEPLARQVLDGLPTVGAVSPDRIAVCAGVPPLDVLRCLPGLEVRGLVEDTPAGWQLTPLARGATSGSRRS